MQSTPSPRPTRRARRAPAAAALLAAALLPGCFQTPALDQAPQAGLSMRLRDGLEVLPMPSRRLAADEAWTAMAPAFAAMLRRQAVAGADDWDGRRRAPLWNRGRRVFQTGEALRPAPLRLASGPDRSGRLQSLPLRAADDQAGRASAD